MEISPSTAAELAEAVYAVQDLEDMQVFLGRSEFSFHNKRVVEARIGGRIFFAKDAFALCAAGGEQYRNQIFCIFRGTTTANWRADWLADVRVGIELSASGLPVHMGFNQTFTSMLPQIRTFLGANPAINGAIHCIGHSLGGAVATLAADWLVRHRSNPVRLYTFGAPRVGTERFAAASTRAIGATNVKRVFHATDPVPMVPIFPYVHMPDRGPTYHLPSDAPLTTGIAHGMERYINSVRSKGWRTIALLRAEPIALDTVIEQWLRSRLPINPSSTQFWWWVERALIYVLKRIGMGALFSLQSTFVGAWTLADKLAFILAKGIEISVSISQWVRLLMSKIMNAVGMTLSGKTGELTRVVIRLALHRIILRMREFADKAVRATV